jgi:hypothetical protein
MERLWQVPDPPEQYLQEVYGSNWMVPDPGYDTILSNPARTAESLPLALCLSYVRVFEALQEGKLARASALVAQILSRTEDPFLADLRTRIDRRFGSKAPRTGSDG